MFEAPVGWLVAAAARTGPTAGIAFYSCPTLTHTRHTHTNTKPVAFIVSSLLPCYVWFGVSFDFSVTCVVMFQANGDID